MKINMLSLLCVLLASTALHAREFTDKLGRKMNAEIVGVTGETVALLRAGETRPVGAAISLFSEEDQKFIREWAVANTKYSFDVAYTKKKLDSSKQRSGPETFITEMWSYRIDLKNRMPTEYADLRVDYWLFMKGDEGKGKGTARVQTSGSQKLAQVKGSITTSFETTPVEINKTKLDGGYFYTDGSRQNFSDSVGGIVIRVFDKNDREVFKYATKEELFAGAVGKPAAPGSSSTSTSTPK